MDRARALIAVAVACGAGGRAHAQTCPPQAVESGPLFLAPGPADFGQVPEACAATQADLRLRSEILVDRPDFYGALTGAATLRAKLRLGPRWALSAALDAASYRLAVNAAVQSSGVGVGPATVGGARMFETEAGLAAIYARVLLPFDSARRHGAVWGGELGVCAARRLPRSLRLAAGASFPATLAVVEGAGHGTLRPGGLLEVAWGPRPWAALAAGVAARTELAPDPTVLALALRPSALLIWRQRLTFGIGADVPVAGRDRTDLTVSLLAGFAGAAGRAP